MENNNGKPWTVAQNEILKKLIEQNTPTRLIALKLSRTEGSIKAKVSNLGLSLKPTNQSPYNRKKL
jgi:hypothetical protein